MILLNTGKVLDVACMISEPNIDNLTTHNKQKLKKLFGARSTAAWNASISGIAIQVSEDGPITVYKHGDLMAQID